MADDRFTHHQPADGTTQHVQATTDGNHDITLKVERRDVAGDLIAAWMSAGYIAQWNGMQKGVSVAIPVAMTLAMLAHPLRAKVWLVELPTEDDGITMNGIKRSSWHKGRKLIEDSGLLSSSKLGGRWHLLAASPEDLADAQQDPQTELFLEEKNAEESAGARAPGRTNASPSAGARAPGRTNASPSAGARAPGRISPPAQHPPTLDSKTAFSNLRLEDDDVVHVDRSQLASVLRTEARCFNRPKIDEALDAAPAGLTLDGVRWCIKRARTRHRENRSQVPGLVLRMIADGDWLAMPSTATATPSPTADVDADFSRERRDQLDAEIKANREAWLQAQRDERDAELKEIIAEASAEQLAEAHRHVIENAPTTTSAALWAKADPSEPKAPLGLRVALCNFLTTKASGEESPDEAAPQGLEGRSITDALPARHDADPGVSETRPLPGGTAAGSLTS